LSREAGVNRGEAGTCRKVSADNADRRRVNHNRAIRDRHAHAAMAAQNALDVSGLVVAGVVTRLAMPLDGVRLEVVVRRLDDGQPEDRRKLQRKRSGGGPPDPGCVVRPRHAAKVVPASDTRQDGPPITGPPITDLELRRESSSLPGHLGVSCSKVDSTSTTCPRTGTTSYSLSLLLAVLNWADPVEA